MKRFIRNIVNWVGAILLGAVIIIAVVLITIGIGIWGADKPQKEFNSEKWLSKPDKRTEMIDELVTSKLLDHKSKTEIIKLLGEPLDHCSYFLSSGRNMIYNLGKERNPFGVDSEWLLIWLNKDTVSKYEVTTD